MKDKDIPASFQVTPDLYATKGSRFGNFIVDIIIRTLLVNLLDLIALGLFHAFGYSALLEWLYGLQNFTAILLSLFIIACYYIIMEALTQRTIGKYLTRTKVVLADGTKPPVSVILARTLCRFIPLDPFSYLGDNSRGWHDTIPDVYVVDIRKFEEAIELQNSFDTIGQDPGQQI